MGRSKQTKGKDDLNTYYKLLHGKHYKRGNGATSHAKGMQRYQAGTEDDIVPFGPGENHPKVDGVRWALADGEAAPDAPALAEEFVGKYKLSPRGGAWFDVVNVATGEPVNSNALREDDAKALLEGYAAPGGNEEEDE